MTRGAYVTESDEVAPGNLALQRELVILGVGKPILVIECRGTANGSKGGEELSQGIVGSSVGGVLAEKCFGGAATGNRFCTEVPLARLVNGAAKVDSACPV